MFSASKNRGFTLIELLVVMGIFIILTSVVLARQNRFSSDILLTNTAYQVAISIRQAQIYGIGVRGSEGQYDTGYGLHFAGGTPLTSYTFFPDLDESGDYRNINGDDELVAAGYSTLSLTKGKITDVCPDDVVSHCLSQNKDSYFDVVYIRPHPDAIIQNNFGYYSKLIITVSSLLGNRFKCVTVYRIGQVAVSNPISNGANPCLSDSGSLGGASDSLGGASDSLDGSAE